MTTLLTIITIVLLLSAIVAFILVTCKLYRDTNKLFGENIKNKKYKEYKERKMNKNIVIKELSGKKFIEKYGKSKLDGLNENDRIIVLFEGNGTKQIEKLENFASCIKAGIVVREKENLFFLQRAWYSILYVEWINPASSHLYDKEKKRFDLLLDYIKKG